ncbi:MAG: hypothetical protein ABIQ40_18550 [Bacteroidia bacterium]
MQHFKTAMRQFLILFFCSITVDLFSQPDTLRHQADEIETNYSLFFRIDSLINISDTIRIFKIRPDNITIHTLVMRGAPIGLFRSYYPDGSICEEAMFDSIPKKIVEPTGTDGATGFATYYLTTPIYLNKYYRNKKLWKEMMFKPNPDYREYSQRTYLITFQATYFRNGNIESYNSQTDTLVKTMNYDYKQRLKDESIKTKNSLVSSYYYYDDNDLLLYDGTIPKNVIIRTVMKKVNNDSQSYDYNNRTVYIYNLADNKLIKKEIYKKNKLMNKKNGA